MTAFVRGLREPQSNDGAPTSQRILRVEYEFPQHVRVSRECKDLLKQILVPEPSQRCAPPTGSCCGLWTGLQLVAPPVACSCIMSPACLRN